MFETTTIPDPGATTAPVPAGIDQLLALDPSVTIGTNPRGIVLATCTAFHLGVFQSRDLRRNAEFPSRFRVLAGGGVYIASCDGRRKDKLNIALVPDTRVGIRSIGRATPNDVIMTIAVFPVAAVLGVEPYEDTPSLWD
jgi:hypothetical protein